MTITKVYQCALRPPVENAWLVREQLRLGNKYRNALVEVERARRAELRQLMSSYGDMPALEDAVLAAREGVDSVLAAMKRSKSAARTRSVSEEQRAALKAAKEVRKTATAALKAARAALRADPVAVAAIDEIAERFSARRKDAYFELALDDDKDKRWHAASDEGPQSLYWGNRQLMNDQDSAARKKPLWDWKTGEPSDPRFVRWSRPNAVGVQTQGGLAVADIGTSLHMRIEDRALPPGADPQSKKSAKRRYCTLAMRVDSTDIAGKRPQPIWARWPMLMHRPLPADGVIKRVSVHVKRVGPHEEWTALITVESEMSASHPTPDIAQNRVAVDIGWRVVEGGLRVAAWRTDSGEHGTLVLDQHWLGGMLRADSLQKTRKDNFNVALAALRAAVTSLALPEWFPKNLWQWESPARLAALALRWRANRFQGDREAYWALETWRNSPGTKSGDLHLWQWECHQRTNSLRQRREVYRRFAAQMARKYSCVVLENFDLRKVARKPKTEEQEGDNEQARANRQRAAVSELRTCIKQAFAGRVEVVPAAYTTMTCSSCSSVEVWDKAKEVEHTCGACGVHWDQDDNAARNLLAYEQPEPTADGTSGVTEIKEKRWVKARRMAAEKAGRKKRILDAAE